MKKFFLVAVTLFAFAAASFAADIVHLDLNYWCRGNLKLLTEKLPEGVKVSARKNYSQKKFAHICFYTIDVDLDKAQELEHSFTVKGSGKLVISVNPRTMKNGKQEKVAPRVKCIRMVVNGKPTKTPFVFNKWRYAANPIMVKDGDTITVDAAFEEAN